MRLYFEEFYKMYQNKIKNKLKEYLEGEIKNNFSRNNKCLEKFDDIFFESFFGGKYLRGVLVAFGYYLFVQETNIDAILFPCISYEIFQTSILLKDDIIDNSTYRRGKFSLYKGIENIVGDLEQAKGITICLSDYAYGLAIKALLESDFCIERKLLALDMMIDNINNTLIGQILDINMSFRRDSITQDEILSIAYYKTAFYTTIGPFSMGGILAEVSKDKLKQIYNFGTYLGIAFQIQDDILGIFGDRVGKSVKSDIEEGKKTLLYEYTMKNASYIQKKEFASRYGTFVSDSDIDKIKSIIVESGALCHAKKIKEQYKQKALDEVKKMKLDDKKTKMIKQMCERYINRNK